MSLWVAFLVSKVRSYLSGNPGVKIKLCDNLVVGRQNSGGDFEAYDVLLMTCSCALIYSLLCFFLAMDVVYMFS